MSADLPRWARHDMPKRPPETSEEWWALVDYWWDELLGIIAHHIQITSPAYDPPGQSLEQGGVLTGRTVLEELGHLRSTRDRKRLPRYFHASWALASEAYAWSVPGWSVLCDLCSEEWCLFTDEERTGV